jgi:peptidoglycan/xylan/chitin deacetylase (PgdA/CDA1 family)
MRGAAALVLAMSASVLVLGPASAQRATTGAAPPLVSPAPPLAPAPEFVPAPALAPAGEPAPSIATAPLSTPAPARAPVGAPAIATTTPGTMPAPALSPPPRRAPMPAAIRASAPAAPKSAPKPTLAPARAAAPPPAPAPQRAARPAAQDHCDNPNGLGVSRTVEIDTSGGPGFGFEHFRQHDFLREHEVVLTFDDGPWVTTPHVLKALAEECVKATFFPIGKHATYYPEILRQVAKAGHTVGSHTWSHQSLSKKSKEEAIDEIEKGVAAVKWALEGTGQQAPFFRFPALRHPPEIVTYLGERNVGIFSTDMDSFDFKMRKPEQVIRSVMAKLKKHGKGIVLMHDFQHPTSQAVPELLAQLKAGGYKIVHLRPKFAATSLPKYDEELIKDQKLPTVSQRPTSSVVRTVE